MKLEIVTPEKIIYEGDVDELYINTADGEIGILPHHVNLFTKVMPGEMKLVVGGKDQYMAITGGFLEVSDNKVTLIADYAVEAEEINVDKAIAAQKRAEEILKKKESQISDKDFAEAQSVFRQAILELKVANRRRRKSS